LKLDESDESPYEILDEIDEIQFEMFESQFEMFESQREFETPT
jgi:hypothetical protein